MQEGEFNLYISRLTNILHLKLPLKYKFILLPFSHDYPLKMFSDSTAVLDTPSFVKRLKYMKSYLGKLILFHILVFDLETDSVP